MRTLLTPCARLCDHISLARLSSNPGQLMFGLGITNVLLLLPLTIATLHNAVGALVLLTLVTVNLRAFQSRQQYKGIST